MRIIKGQGFTFCPAEQCRLLQCGEIVGVPYSVGNFSASVVAHWSKDSDNPHIDAFLESRPPL
jgi:hypothetical protein